MTTRLRRTHLAALTLAAVVAAPIIATNAGASPDVPAAPKTASCPTTTTFDPSTTTVPCTTTSIYIPPLPTTTSTSTTTTTAPPLDPAKPAVPECRGLNGPAPAGVAPSNTHFEAIRCTFQLNLLVPIYQPANGAFMPGVLVNRLDVAQVLIRLQDLLRERLAGAPVPTTTTTTAPTTTTTVAPPVFNDLPDEMTANEKFQALLEAGIYKGGADGTFDPDGQMTREQFAAIMARLLGVHGVGTPPAAPNPFADVTGWAQGYIAAVSEVGLIQGFGDGTFKPGGFVTSAHVATVVARFLAIPQLQS